MGKLLCWLGWHDNVIILFGLVKTCYRCGREIKLFPTKEENDEK